MSQPLVECVPNFSEGRDHAVIEQITNAIEAVDGVSLLDVDPGASTNRTVVTLVGAPEPVLEAAVAAGRKAKELIDMSRHSGEHPRFGGMDVCPLVPVSGISMDEVVELARRLGRRLGEEVGLSIYLYEHAASKPERRNLAVVRSGEYEGLADKLKQPGWAPDFGPAELQPRTGATAVGARDFLVAYNVNLNTTSTRRANAIAFDVREKGRKKREGDSLTGPVVKDAEGREVWIPGSLEHVKGIGWYIEEYGVAQISMNLTNIRKTPIHVAFDEVCRKAEARGVRVTGSEMVGMVPLEAMLEAGRHYLRKQQRSLGVPDRELIKIAVRSLGLDELAPFEPDKKIIELAIADHERKRLVDLSCTGFVEETASESVAPGGGSVAALCGALGAALGTMVANLSSHKRGWDERWEEFSRDAVQGKHHYVELLRLVDADTDAFNGLMAAFRMSADSAEERAERERAIQDATRQAIEVPLAVMEQAVASMGVIKAMAERGQPSSASDAGVGALCARSAAYGAYLNVKTNLKDLSDKQLASELLERAEELRSQAGALEHEILALVEGHFGNQA